MVPGARIRAMGNRFSDGLEGWGNLDLAPYNPFCERSAQRFHRFVSILTLRTDHPDPQCHRLPFRIVGPHPLLFSPAMSLLVLAGIAGGVAVASAVAVGIRWAFKTRPPTVEAHEPPQLPVAPKAVEPELEAYGVSLGDVILLRESEAWVTGVLCFFDGAEEEAALFFTNETSKGDVLLIRPLPRRAMFLVHAVELPEGGVGAHTIEQDRELFTRTRRVPITMKQHGIGCPTVDGTATWTWHESPGGDVLATLQAGACTLAWRGRRVDDGTTLRLAAGQATFRE